MPNKIFVKLAAAMTTAFASLFGRLTWNTPPWINYLRHHAHARPKKFWASALICAALSAALIYGFYWYHSLPRPERVVAQLTPPKITPLDTLLVPDVLTLDFGILSNGKLSTRPVAPLDSIGKQVAKGITIRPEIKGKWVWDSDSRLVFTPETDWPAGQRYTISFTRDFFTPNANMASMNASFDTLPFEAAVQEFKFYQDPLNPQLRQAVATINFNFPVNPDSLDKNIALKWQAVKSAGMESGPASFHFSLNYDEHKRTAYLRSESIPLPSAERFLELTLKKGIKPLTGTAETTDTITAKVLVPDAGSYFKVTHAATSIVRNPKDRPEQILTVETSLGITDPALNSSLQAYLLPRDYPATASLDAKKNYPWQDPGEVTPAILALSKPLSLEPVPSDREFSDIHSYRYHADSPGYVYLKIQKGARGFGGFALANDYSTVLSVPAYPKEITFLHKGALLALGTEEKLSVLVRGLSAVKFNIARVLPDDINHLVTQTGGDFSNPFFLDPNFNQDNISQVFSRIQPFDASDPGKEQYTALDLGGFMTAESDGNAPLGLFLLQAAGWDTVNNYAVGAQTSRLILITDLGLIVKNNINGTHDLYVQSITRGLPVSNATVSILGKNGLPLLTRATDAQGHAGFPDLGDFINEREPAVYIVRNGNDVSFIPYNRYDRQLNYSRFDTGGLTSNSENPAALTAYVFTDRGLYRPGDTAHIAMIVKRPYVLPQPAGLPLQATVVDPRGVTAKDVKMTLDDSGYLTLDFQTLATSPTGQYQVYLYIVKDNHASSLIGSTTLRVEEFLPDRMRISTHLSAEPSPGWISPQALTAKVGLWNLYGAPAANRQVSGKMLLSPRAVTFKDFPDYTFIDPLLNPKSPPKVFNETLSDTHTDNQGQAVFDLKLDRFEKGTYQLSVFVEGYEAEGGRSVAAQTTALISPLDYLVGYKPDGALNYIKQNSTRSIHFIAVNPRLKQQELPDLKISLFRLRPVSTLIKKEDGTYQYQSVIQSSQISSQPFAIQEQGTDFALPSDEIGDYLVSVADSKDAELSRFKFSVIGNSQQPLPKNAELNVKLNKSEFNPGEEIEMQIMSPYSGSGLITIERNKVYAAQWFKTDQTSSVQKIRIPADFQGNGYINIAFVRDLNSPEIFMSPLSYSIMPFAVTHEKQDMRIQLTAPKLVRPGEDLTMTYQSDKPGKIIVFAVDEGILQVYGYQTPDPLQFFFAKHALEVNTMQIVDQILPKFIAERELSAVGGDEGEAALKSNLNPFKRKTEAPVVYWSGLVDTDTTPRNLTYHVPDYFNGALRVMAVAAGADAVGSAAQSTEVRGYFVISPNVPTFVAPGDTFEVTAAIANNIEGSGANARVSVRFDASSQLELLDASDQGLIVPEGEERSVRIRVRAKSTLGAAEIRCTAAKDDKSSSMVSTLSVRPSSPYSSSVTSGFTKDAHASLPLDRMLYQEFRHVEAAASPSPLILVSGLKNYLNDYPYGCVEQLVSKAFPWLAMADQPWFAEDKDSIREKIQQTIQLLSQRQMSSGGFNYWPENGSSQGNDFASVYAMHFLTEARSQGYNIPKDVYSAGVGFLKEVSVRTPADLDQARVQAYAIYLLTRNEMITTNYLTNLQLALDRNPDLHARDDITYAYIAATYQLLQNAAEADKFIRYFKPLSLIGQANDFYNANTVNAQYLYLIAKHFPQRLQALDDALVMTLVNALNDNTMSTILAGYATLALNSYAQSSSTPVANDNITIREVFADGKEHELASTPGLYKIVLPGLPARKINFDNPGRQPMFYQLIQEGFDREPPKKIINQGMEVMREYRSEENNPVTGIQLGRELTVHIRVRSNDNRYHDNIALIDLLPGGFEVVGDSIQTQDMDYVDVREDRVIFFTGIGPESREITYRIKATTKGQFTIPPIMGASMYNPGIKSMGEAGKMSVD
ncbi:hypothetical protein AQUSIP_25750 [Aquicella siphonis]|uniref:Lipoprotein YfhM n=1 Tax=Aquicella siphonis TaxID=254247 RepID=A0A5E4PL19_9COXI|nr:alpha-2-macroglobulin [Aquicella siphonis]VVC77248.1 hypothetical protein AQUSIP_25750 [Aquicella siphonis]